MRTSRPRAGTKGFSSIVGAVFMVLIMTVLASSYFVFTLSANTAYNDTVRQKNQLDLDRMAESTQVLDTTYSANAGGNVTVSAQIKNNGPSSIQFITVWIYVSNTTWTNYNFGKLTNASVQGGNVFLLNVNLTVSGISSTANYNLASWLITTRGNVVTLQKTTLTNNIIVSQTTQGIGALMMDFQNFTYYNVTGSNQLTPFPNGASGYVVSSGYGNIAFRVILTNLDQQQGTINLSSNSVFFSIFPTSPQQVRGSYWYIANVNGSGVISSTYTPVILSYNVPVAVYFASDHAIVSGQPFVAAPPHFTGASPVNLALIGQLGSNSFGQNIPFVSILVLN
jgi:hypothetical protein